jgi:hypothetical protein
MPEPRQPQQLAKLAGLLYLSMMPFGFFAIVYIPSILLGGVDPTIVVDRLAAGEGLIRLGTVSHIVGQVLFLALVLTLYRLLHGVNSGWAVLMVAFATIGIPLTLYNEVHHIAALRLVMPSGAAAWLPAQQAALVLEHLAARSTGITLSQVFWGLWLLPLGLLVWTAPAFPRWLGLLLLLAGVGYLIDVAVTLLAPASTVRLTQFTFIGELVFPIWLLMRGKARLSSFPVAA